MDPYKNMSGFRTVWVIIIGFKTASDCDVDQCGVLLLYAQVKFFLLHICAILLTVFCSLFTWAVWHKIQAGVQNKSPNRAIYLD